MKRAAPARSLQASGNTGSALVRKDRETGERIGERLPFVGLHSLEREAETLQAFLDDPLRTLLGTEQAPLANEPRSQVLQVLDAGVDVLAESVEHGATS